MFDPNQPPKFNKDEYVKKRSEELRKHILDDYVKPDEYYEKGEEAKKVSYQMIGNGVYFRNELIGYNSNDKAPMALGELSDEISEKVQAHGIASNVPLNLNEDQKKKFPLFALLQIMATAEIKGDSAPLKTPDGTPFTAFTNAPFVLLSNKDEPLTEYDQKKGVNRIKNLRTVLVNGQYESMVDDLKKRFPGVSFRTAEQIDDSIFEKKSPPFKSFEDQIKEKIESEIKEKGL